MNDEVVVVERNGPIATVRINRPEVHNALNRRVLTDLDRALATLAAEDVRAIVLTGTGTRAFSAGADLDELSGLSSEQAYTVLSAGQEVVARIERSPVPVIAAVNGLALGGGFEVVLACTFAVLADGAQLGLPETGLGLLPGYGGSQRLFRRVGRPVAAFTILTGERIPADRAYALGLTPTAPVPVEQVVDAARDLALRIAARGPRAVRAVLLALRHGADVPLDAGLAFESALAGLVTGGEEAAEGIAAFRARRSPAFDATRPDAQHDGTGKDT
ncbi:enoyl-CoA hydratase [Modestobacter sp. DSM 44400]|uniref:enoyl-CoA hydratase/isomerase family protein n=1 Tax=Modestobacter sp. DSM 44400 TaxID=1550230 RepID=UPI000898791F|nr:enoyl-CoA hydratase-related protein [Modestobacter sp. DSM 44400]SDY61601.1 enoyl-CoA hydratase [Modestobacter sp. DSM 44400]